MRLTVLLLTLIFLGNLFAQENEIYIANELKNLEKLREKLDLVDGFIFLPNDTLPTKLLKFKGKRKVNTNLFCVAQDGDTVKIFYPSEILGYKIEEDFYRSHGNETGSFFLKQRVLGAIDLYECMSLPSSPNFNYYLRFNEAKEFIVINPDKPFYKSYEIPDISQYNTSNSAIASITKSTGVKEMFDLFAVKYLIGCPEVVKMILTEFLTIQDIPDIIETYNDCSF